MRKFWIYFSILFPLSVLADTLNMNSNSVVDLAGNRSFFGPISSTTISKVDHNKDWFDAIIIFSILSSGEKVLTFYYSFSYIESEGN